MTELGDLRPELCEGMIEARTIPAGGDETGAPIPAPQANGESSVQGAASMLLNQDFLASYDGSAAVDATYDSVVAAPEFDSSHARRTRNPNKCMLEAALSGARCSDHTDIVLRSFTVHTRTPGQSHKFG